MAISNLTNIAIKAIGEAKIKEIEKAKGGFGYENKIRDIERELDKQGVAFIPQAMQKLRDLFGSYVESYKYGNIEKEIKYNVK